VITQRRSVHHQTRPSIVTMGVTIEQHAHNGRLTWVHVSTLRATRRSRTFPGSITVDPTKARVRLSRQQVRELTGIKPPPITDEQRWQEIFRQLEQIDPAIIAQCVAPPPPIPRTRIRSLFQECRTCTSLKEQARWAQQLTPTALASVFTESVEEFKPYRNTEPFYPASRKPLPVPSANQAIRTSRDLAILLNVQGTAEVVNDPCLNFRYVDCEIVPARTTGGTYADLGKGTTWVRLDQLLVAEHPVIAEVKLRNDKNPFYALIQALTAAAELATRAQHQRLQRHYSQHFANTNDAGVDIYIITYRSYSNGPIWDVLRVQTQNMCRALSLMPAVRQYIGRFAILELHEPANGIVSFERVFKT
jgi:hypothetical protein